jgi:hypothetical protein
VTCMGDEKCVQRIGVERFGRRALGLVRSRALKWNLNNWVGQVAGCE